MGLPTEACQYVRPEKRSVLDCVALEGVADVCSFAFHVFKTSSDPKYVERIAMPGPGRGNIIIVHGKLQQNLLTICDS
jgi:hypothetical protein